MASAEEVTNNNTGLTDPQPLENENPSKRRRTVKPLPSFLTSLTLSKLPEYEVITEKESVIDNDNPGATKELDHAVAIKKNEEEVSLKSLTVDQLRKLCMQLNIKRSNLSRQVARFWIAQTAKDVGALSEAISARSCCTSTACRIINSIFHCDNISKFVTFNNSWSRCTHEVGSGGNFERFWNRIASWVNGDGTPNKNTNTGKGHEDSNKNGEEGLPDEDSVQSTISEQDGRSARRSPENTPEPYEICFLSYKENALDDEPYNGHISRATTEEKINPGILSGMTEKITSQEVQRTVMDLFKICHEMKKCMELSGSHNSNSMNFVVAGIRCAKASNLNKFSAYYFYMKSMDVSDFYFYFSSGLVPAWQIDSTTELAAFPTCPNPSQDHVVCPDELQSLTTRANLGS